LSPDFELPIVAPTGFEIVPFEKRKLVAFPLDCDVRFSVISSGVWRSGSSRGSWLHHDYYFAVPTGYEFAEDRAGAKREFQASMLSGPCGRQLPQSTIHPIVEKRLRDHNSADKVQWFALVNHGQVSIMKVVNDHLSPYEDHLGNRNGESLAHIDEYLKIAHDEQTIEVRSQDLDYLRKPDGDWEFRKVVEGDTWAQRTDDGIVEMPNTFISIGMSAVLSGYRWCRPRYKTHGLGQFILDTRAAARWVEYPIVVDECNEYVCFVIHHADNRSTVELNITELPSVVGFGGVQFEGQAKEEFWTHNLSANIDQDGVLWNVSQHSGDSRMPAAPIKARFRVKGTAS
jgi:hypothetical protein